MTISLVVRNLMQATSKEDVELALKLVQSMASPMPEDFSDLDLGQRIKDHRAEHPAPDDLYARFLEGVREKSPVNFFSRFASHIDSWPAIYPNVVQFTVTFYRAGVWGREPDTEFICAMYRAPRFYAKVLYWCKVAERSIKPPGPISHTSLGTNSTVGALALLLSMTNFASMCIRQCLQPDRLENLEDVVITWIRADLFSAVEAIMHRSEKSGAKPRTFLYFELLRCVA